MRPSSVIYVLQLYDGHLELKCHLKTYLPAFKDILWKSLKLQLFFNRTAQFSLSIKGQRCRLPVNKPLYWGYLE